MLSDESDDRLGPRGTGAGKAPVRLRGSRWRNRRTAVAAATAGVLFLAAAPSASAQPGDPAFPSEEQVEQARQRAADTARSVQAIQADLAAANQQLESLGMAAAQAAEAYNGARWRLQRARDDAREARRQADRAVARMERQRDGIGALVAATYQGGSDLGQVRAYLAARDPDALLDRFAAFHGASATMQARMDRFRAAHSLTQVFRQEAARAVARADRAEQRAEDARQRAEDAVAAQQAAVSGITDRKDALVHELARAQSISVRLAAQRQQALERQAELRRQRAARRAAEAAREQAAAEAAERAAQAREARAAERAAEAAERREARRHAQQAREQAQQARERAREAQEARDARAARQARAEAREARQEAREARQEAREARQERIEARREARQARREARQARQERRAERRETRASQPAGGSQAVSFAMAQLGEPYVWGGAGPDVWDCSGLTAGAWGSAGSYLPHYSVAQYYATSRVSYSQLRPGDLIFWSSNGSPSGIFHVAMYIGGDQMVHAPNSSTTVQVEDVWYWQAPDFFGRV